MLYDMWDEMCTYGGNVQHMALLNKVLCVYMYMGQQVLT